MTADILDNAAELEDQHRSSAIAQLRSNIETPPLFFNNLNCIECDEEIPPVRLNLGKFRCIDCQEELEKRQGLFRK